MFEDWKQAWRDAVDNFRRELGDVGAAPGAGGETAMQRELAHARATVRRLDHELRHTADTLEQVRQEEQTCRRRETMARGIGDAETARVAAEYAARAAERAGVLARKLEVLQAERDLHGRDLDTMERIAAERQGVGPGAPSAPEPDQAEREAAEFRRMERSAREDAAAARLEELRRRMQQEG